MAEIIMAFCANTECCAPITIENWGEGGAVEGYPYCPECFRVEEAREQFRKDLAEGSFG